ncbi:MAG: 1-acyl-sn-glycerol-3-phosphate acyltransferase [Candidatus Sungbacteria bacterium]|nr:1-acyl-sn-glycerol-3-phosphate acyltransferase [Candidatus Sungbacteria bacterium]
MFGFLIYFILQKIYWPLLRVTLFTLFNVEIRDPHGTLSKTPRGTIIVANHKTPLDPFIISIAFPWLSSIYPIRFMANFRKFNDQALEFLRKIGIIYVIYFLFGAFSSRRGQGIERALELPISFLNHKQSVLIFPEGSMVLGHELGTIRRGAGILAAKTGAPVLPVALRYRRKKYILNIGELFQVPSYAIETESTEKVHMALQPLFQEVIRN